MQPAAPEPARLTSHAERGRRLAERIMAHALTAGLGPGSRLPTERKLALDLGTTRSSVRQALDILQAQARISREVGRGTFLLDDPQPPTPPGSASPQPPGSAAPQPPGSAVPQAPAPPGPAGPQAPGSADLRAAITTPGSASGPAGESPALPGSADFAPADVMTIRRLLEPPAMSLVVAWATTADLEQMDRCLTGGDHAASYEEFEVWDLALHRTIMAASHSPLLIALYAVIEAARHGQVWGDLKRRSASPANRKDYQCDHRAIVTALRARDSATAVEAMRVHLARVAGHLNATDPAAAVTWR
jgi:DNA-binding FadR family transcriptional regulator